jgi:FMN phosphatase YigB (HAD superfamily)
MNILLYTEPRIERGNPNFRLYSALNDLPVSHCLKLKEQGLCDFRLLVGEFTYQLLSERQPQYMRKLRDIVLVLPNKVLKEISGNTLRAQVELYHNERSPESIDCRYVDGLHSALAGFVPDVVVSWESPAAHIQKAFPKALLLNQQNNSLFRFENSSQNGRYTFDPDLRGSVYLHDEPRPIDKEQQAMLEDIARRYVEGAAKNNSLQSWITSQKEKFSRVFLLPLQGSHFNFEGNFDVGSQYDLVEYVLDRLPKDVGLVVTEHHLLYGEDLGDKNIAALQRKYPNFLFSVATRIPHSSTKIVPFVDGVVAVSSSLVVSAVLLDKAVCVLGAHWLKVFSNTTLDTPHIVKPTREKNLARLFHYIFKYSINLSQDPSGVMLLDFLRHLKACQPSISVHSYREITAIGEQVQTINRLFTHQESMRGARYTAFRKNLGECNVITFDIFDTLVHRNCTFPSDVFELMAPKVNRLLGAPIKFLNLRLLAEGEANTRSRREDTTLDEIYEVLEGWGIPAKHCEEIKRLEIETELSILRCKPSGFDMYREAEATGKPIFFISDMYLPRKILFQILLGSGYTGVSENQIYVSSEVGLKKHTKSLFSHISTRENLVFNRWLHVGDNPSGDIQAPKELGIRTLHTPAALPFFLGVEANGYWKKRPDIKKFSLDDRIALGVIANGLFENPWARPQKSCFNGSLYNVGFYGLGPFLFSLVRWLIKECKRNKVENLAFLLRDGYLPHRIWNAIGGSESGTRAVAIYASRQLFIRPLLAKMPLALFQYNEVAPGAHGSREVLENWIGAELPAVGTRPMIDCLAGFPQATQQAVQQSLERMTQYFTTQIGPEPTAVFDVGYRGRAQVILERLLDRKLLGLYAVRNENCFCDDAGIENEAFWTENAGTGEDGYNEGFNPILELALSDPNPGLGHFAMEGEDGDTMNGADNAEQVCEIAQLQRGILDFCERLHTVEKDLGREIRLTKGFVLNPLKNLVAHPDDLRCLNKLTLENGIARNQVKCGDFLKQKTPRASTKPTPTPAANLDLLEHPWFSLVALKNYGEISNYGWFDWRYYCLAPLVKPVVRRFSTAFVFAKYCRSPARFFASRKTSAERLVGKILFPQLPVLGAFSWRLSFVRRIRTQVHLPRLRAELNANPVRFVRKLGCLKRGLLCRFLFPCGRVEPS